MPPTKKPTPQPPTKKPAAAPAKPAASKAPEKKDALATVPKNQALASSQIGGYDLMQDAQEFDQQFDRSDFAIPFLRPLQSNSPEVQEGGPSHIEGAKAGMFILTSTKEVFDGVRVGIDVVPVHYRHTVVEWKLRESGGGFVKDHGPELLASLRSFPQDEKGRFLTEEGNQLVETMTYTVMFIHPDGETEAVGCFFPLTSTQLKKGRGWNSIIDGLRIEHNGKKVRPPMFYMSYHLTTVYESNDKGSWYGVVIAPSTPLTEMGEKGAEIYAAARTLRESISRGEVAYEKSAMAEQVTDEGEKAPF